MAVFGTADAQVLMPREIADGMITQARSDSTAAKLSAREPMKFGNVDYVIFNDFPKAEFVGEGAQKSSTSGGFDSVQATPKKAQVTMRFNEEVQWLDEDYQLDVLRTLGEAGGLALSRALDLGLYHRINPLSGTVIAGWTNYISATTNTVEVNYLDPDQDADDAFVEAAGLLINASPTWGVNGVAFDPRYVWQLSQLKRRDGSGETSDLRYPNIGLGQDLGNFMGVNAAVGDTVSAQPEAADTNIRAILGDFRNGLRWGIQREFPIELIRFGDPDGQGDLKRNNQIALRMEIVYAWYAFLERFAKIVDAVVDVEPVG